MMQTQQLQGISTTSCWGYPGWLPEGVTFGRGNGIRKEEEGPQHQMLLG